MFHNSHLPKRTYSISSSLNYSDDDHSDHIEKNEHHEIYENYENHKEVSHLKALWGVHKSIDHIRGDMSYTRLSERNTRVDNIMDDEDEKFPPSYIVLTISKETPDNTLAWLIHKIKGNRRDGGAELIVMRQPREISEDYVFHISANKLKFLESAEEMEMMKKDVNGEIQEFTVKQLDDFLLEDMSIDDLFTMADKQTIVRHELENIRALPEDVHVPGFPTITLYEGQSIFSVCRQNDIIINFYPLHDEEHLKKLGFKWYISQKQPFEEIRLYFGEAIALYFTFLGYYTTALVVPVALGILQILIPTESILLLCAFNVVWVTVMLELWKRKSNELAFQWGTIGMTSLDEPRANFCGVMDLDPITGKPTPLYPRYYTYFKMYCVSLPLVFLCMIGAFFVMLCSFWAENWTKTFDEQYASLAYLPSIIYTILVFIMNKYYRKLATYLTEWENHRTESQFYRHKVTKFLLFEFVDNFMSLFYIAFVIQDLSALRSQLQTMLIISQFMNNLTETILPLFMKYWSLKAVSRKKKVFKDKWNNQARIQSKGSGDQEDPLKSIPVLDSDDSRVLAAEIEGNMEVYEETFDDYMELFIQFGYVFLFSSVYPIAGLWALLYNLIEIRADAFKLCQICQRPMSKRVKNIGAWQRAFEVLGALSIVTNCTMVYMNPSMRNIGGNLSETEWLLLFILIEHLLLAVRYILHISIDERPEWVRIALAKQNYESKQALKREREQRNKRLLTRKFKSTPTSL